jgi:peptidoglycan/xylan/chitin deacetylase (PgdA/CDA1 family)
MLTAINYHYIRHSLDAPYPSIFGVAPTAFELQLKMLQDIYDFVHPEDILANPEKIFSAKGNNNLLVTFDDGLKEQYEHALPVLDKLGIPAIFFINSINHTEKKVSLVHKIHMVRSVTSPPELYEELTKSLGRMPTEDEKKSAHAFYRYDDPVGAEVKFILNILLDFKSQEKIIDRIFRDKYNEAEVRKTLYMDDSQLKDLGRRGYLGSHAHSHIPLALYPDEKIKDELIRCASFLSSYSGKPVTILSYPYGTKETCNETVAKIASETGHRMAFTTDRGINDETANHLLLNRFDCNDLPGGKNYNMKNAV